MPITVYQPSPVAPGVSSAYGAAEEYDKLAPTILQYHQLQQQGGLAAASAYQSGQNAVNQRSIAAGNDYAQESMQQQALLQRAQQNAFEQTHQAAMQDAQQTFQAQERQQAQDQHFQQQVAANQIALTQAEQARLVRLQNADSDIDRMVSEGSIRPDEAVEMKTHVRGLRGPLELRAVKAQAQANEAHAQQYEQQAQIETQLQAKRAALASQSVPERTVPTYKPGAEAEVRAELGEFQPGAMGLLGVQGVAQAKEIYEAEVKKRLAGKKGSVEYYTYTDLDGKTHIQTPKAEVGDDQTRHLTETAFNSTVNHTIDQVNRQIRDKGLSEEEKKSWTPEMVRQSVASDIRRRYGMPITAKDQNGNEQALPLPTYKEFQAFQGYKQTVPQVVTPSFAFPGSTPAAQGSAVGSTTPNAAAGQQPDAPAAIRDVKPQPPIRNEKNVTPEQKPMVDALKQTRVHIEQSGWPESQKAEYRELTNRASSLLWEFGSKGNMPPEARAHYVELLRLLSQVPDTPRAAHESRNPDQNPYGGVPSY